MVACLDDIQTFDFIYMKIHSSYWIVLYYTYAKVYEVAKNNCFFKFKTAFTFVKTMSFVSSSFIEMRRKKDLSIFEKVKSWNSHHFITCYIYGVILLYICVHGEGSFVVTTIVFLLTVVV